MKSIILAALLAVIAQTAIADQYVKGYIKRDGTYVQPHVRSSPNNQQWDNYSTKGNTNPYTGERGSARDTTFDNPYLPRQRDRND